MKKLSRREWLRKTAGLAAVAVAAPVLKPLSAVASWTIVIARDWATPDNIYRFACENFIGRHYEIVTETVYISATNRKLDLRFLTEDFPMLEKRGVIDDKTPDMPETVKTAADDKPVHKLDQAFQRKELQPLRVDDSIVLDRPVETNKPVAGGITRENLKDAMRLAKDCTLPEY